MAETKKPAKTTETEKPNEQKISYVTADSKNMFEVTLPIIEGEGDKVVTVNDRRYTIERGKRVKVPEWVYEQLRHEEEMTLAEHAYRQRISDKFKTF